jgi:hypothetical protein
MSNEIQSPDLPSPLPTALPKFSTSALPSAKQEGLLIAVPDESGGFTLAFSDGQDWRRIQDRNIVS